MCNLRHHGLWLGWLALASPGGAQPTPRQCPFPLDSVVVPVAELRQLAGVYELQWRDDVGRPDRRERLWLWPTRPADAQGRAVRLAPDDTLRFPLYGATSAMASSYSSASEPTTLDLIAPPVLMATASGAKEGVWLLVGTGMSRDMSTVTLDGGGVGVRLLRRGPAGFAGEYRSWGVGESGRGYLCARRLSGRPM